MTGNTKRKALILLGMIILFTMIVAASLPQLELQPGMPFPRLQGGQVVAAQIEGDAVASISANRFVTVLIVLMLGGAMLYATYKLLAGADWKVIFSVLRSTLVICVIVSGFVFLLLLLPDTSRYSSPVKIPIPTPEPVVTSPLGSVPTPLLWLVGIGLLIASLLVGVWIFNSTRQARPIDLLALEAEKARQALQTGAGLKDVIIRCYLQMSLAVKQEQGIERQDFMTTGEFEHLLEAAGIPHEPVHQLTRLFDAVRYGNWQSNAAEEQRAVQCLEAIVRSSRESGGRK